jgi:hypothetical protein
MPHAVYQVKASLGALVAPLPGGTAGSLLHRPWPLVRRRMLDAGAPGFVINSAAGGLLGLSSTGGDSRPLTRTNVR